MDCKYYQEIYEKEIDVWKDRQADYFLNLISKLDNYYDDKQLEDIKRSLVREFRIGEYLHAQDDNQEISKLIDSCNNTAHYLRTLIEYRWADNPYLENAKNEKDVIKAIDKNIKNFLEKENKQQTKLENKINRAFNKLINYDINKITAKEAEDTYKTIKEYLDGDWYIKDRKLLKEIVTDYNDLQYFKAWESLPIKREDVSFIKNENDYYDFVNSQNYANMLNIQKCEERLLEKIEKLQEINVDKGKIKTALEKKKQIFER